MWGVGEGSEKEVGDAYFMTGAKMKTLTAKKSDLDKRAIQETFFLISIPGMRESIRKGLQTPVARLSKKLNW